MRMSGLGGETSEAQELLRDIENARNDYIELQKKKTVELKASEESKLKVGEKLVGLPSNAGSAQKYKI